MISFSHVYKTYTGPVHALRDVELQIDKGEFVYITGPSGAGKTTLFRMLSAFDKPTSGHIVVGNYDLGKISAAEVAYFRRRIGVVFQDFRLLKDQTIYDNVALPLMVRGDRSSQIEKRVLEVLEQVGLSDKARQLPEFISGGEQQRTAIARAIVHQPGLLIADEPTGNLDPKLANEITDLLERVCAQGTTVLIATHDLDMVEKRKKRTIHLDSGKVTDV